MSSQLEPPQLSVGDPAPGLHVEEWLNGAPVAALAPGAIYLCVTACNFWIL